jgi:hypothetical protein
MCLRSAVPGVQTEERQRIVAEAERFVYGMIDRGGLENALPDRGRLRSP